MGTREEVSLRSLKDSKDSEVQAGAELGELGVGGAINGEPDRHALMGRMGRAPPTEPPGGDCAGVGLGNALVGEPRDMEASKGAVPTGGVREGCPSIQSSGPY